MSITKSMKLFIYTGTATLLFGCAMMQPTAEQTAEIMRKPNPRVVETDLTKPYFAWYDQETQKTPLAKQHLDSVTTTPLNNIPAPVELAHVESFDRVPAAMPVASFASSMGHVQPSQVLQQVMAASEQEVINHAALANWARLEGKPVPEASQVALANNQAMPRGVAMLDDYGRPLDAQVTNVKFTNTMSTVGPQAPIQDSIEPVQVAFSNESAKLNTQDEGFSSLLDYVNTDAQVFVIGHSHGSSQVGVAKLSQKRADAVARALVKAGMQAEQVHTMASWSTHKNQFTPSLGVQVYIVKSASPERVLLALSR